MKKMRKIKINNSQRVFPVIVREEPEGGFVVSNPAIAGCHSQGETIEEALENITEATELCLEVMESQEKSQRPILSPAISLHLIHA